MKSHAKIRSHHGSEAEGGCFFEIKYPEKSNEESIYYEVFWKKIASKTYSRYQEVFSKIIILKIETSHNGLYKI